MYRYFNFWKVARRGWKYFRKDALPNSWIAVVFLSESSAKKPIGSTGRIVND